MKHTPLPPALSGEIVERLIRVDKSLLYLISGALEYVTDREPYDQTGTLTVEEVRTALGEMIWTYYQEKPQMAIVGEVRWLAYMTAPDGWLYCDGSDVLIEEYPALFAVIGFTYNALPPDDMFRIPDLRFRSPIGTGALDGIGDILLTGDYRGAKTHILTVPELPAHSHVQRRVGGPAGGSAVSFQAATGTNYVDLTVHTGDTGGGEAHSNLHPVAALYPVIYAGL